MEFRNSRAACSITTFVASTFRMVVNPAPCRALSIRRASFTAFCSGLIEYALLPMISAIRLPSPGAPVCAATLATLQTAIRTALNIFTELLLRKSTRIKLGSLENHLARAVIERCVAFRGSRYQLSRFVLVPDAARLSLRSDLLGGQPSVLVTQLPFIDLRPAAARLFIAHDALQLRAVPFERKRETERLSARPAELPGLPHPALIVPGSLKIVD